jgi:SAM-dependent methyltransferase
MGFPGPMSSAERDFWDRRAASWERRADAVNAFTDAYGAAAMDALAAVPGERILDIGCGPGTTTLALAGRVAPGGVVVGVDISSAMLEAASRRALAAGLTNVDFVTADAQTGSLGEGFDGAYSRFGVMFFADPVAAFANIGRSLRGGGRLACAVWAALNDNAWMFVPTLAAAGPLAAELTLPGPHEPGPFSLADAEHLRDVLTRAGFVDITIDRVEGGRRIPTATADEELQILFEIGPLGDAYAAADDDARQAAVSAVMSAIEPYGDSDGWLLPGAASVVSARRA